MTVHIICTCICSLECLFVHVLVKILGKILVKNHSAFLWFLHIPLCNAFSVKLFSSCCLRLALDSVLTNLSSVVYRKIFKKELKVKFRCKTKWVPGPERWRAWTESVVWMVLSVILALFVPQVKYVISPMGCLAAIFMLVFPGKQSLVI